GAWRLDARRGRSRWSGRAERERELGRGGDDRRAGELVLDQGAANARERVLGGGGCAGELEPDQVGAAAIGRLGAWTLDVVDRGGAERERELGRGGDDRRAGELVLDQGAANARELVLDQGAANAHERSSRTRARARRRRLCRRARARPGRARRRSGAWAPGRSTWSIEVERSSRTRARARPRRRRLPASSSPTRSAAAARRRSGAWA